MMRRCVRDALCPSRYLAKDPKSYEVGEERC